MNPDPVLEGHIEELVGRCRGLHEDTGLQAVAQWKATRDLGVAVGTLPIYVPPEIIHAAGALPVGLVGGGDQLDVVRGDAYFQSYICHLPRSMVELGLTRRLAGLDGVIFPAICDVIRNLSGVWTLLFPEQKVWFLDLPQNFHDAVGGAFYADQLRELAQDLGDLTGRGYHPDALRRSLSLYDENRRLVRILHRARRRRPERIPTYEAYLVQRAGHLLPVEEHNDLLRRYLRLALARRRPALDNARIVILGAFCEQPPLALIRSLELAGCFIVDDDMLLGNRLLERRLDGPGDPLLRLARAYLSPDRTCASIYDAGQRRTGALLERVRRLRADGVVFAAPSFCDPALLDRPVYQKALEQAGVPYTALKYAENTRQLGSFREQVGTFAESIRLWGDAPAPDPPRRSP